ncbi:serine hydrolase domain-containing protein [Photobacterium nomapromontoriensis]|uniref:serine hydrolase domain-containing protein n=1 Tax=Photobacterium nomapromontoriensis TaxID=2910237 RepID=UPI003D14FB64
MNTHPIFKSLLLFVLFLSTPYVNADSTQQATQTQKALDDYLAHLNTFGRFSGNVLIAENDKIVYEKSIGLADVKLKRPISADNLFKAGSITKQLTAVAILRLHEQKKLDIHQSVVQYFPKLNLGNEITIAMLLNHTAGLYSDPSWREYKKSCNSRGLINNTLKTSKIYPPSKLFNYSNATYHLLGGIIEQVSGTSYDNYITSELLRPLGMKDSSLKLTLSFQLAKSYELSGLVDAYITPSGCAWSAGELITTSRDLLVWSRALNTGKIIAKPLVDQMFEQQYGIFNEEIGGTSYFLHQGEIDGFKTLLIQEPKTGLTIIALSNFFNTNVDLLAIDLVKITNGEEPVGRIIPPKTNFADWQYDIDVIGNYLDNNGVPLQVVYSDGVLQAKVNQYTIPLKIQNKNSLFAVGIDNRIRINRNENDTTKEIIFFARDGRYLSRFSRITNN